MKAPLYLNETKNKMAFVLAWQCFKWTQKRESSPIHLNHVPGPLPALSGRLVLSQINNKGKSCKEQQSQSRGNVKWMVALHLEFTCRILSCAAGVLGVRRAMLLLVTLYSDKSVLEAEFVIPDSSAVWRAISLAWPTFTTSSSSVSEILKEETNSAVDLRALTRVTKAKETNKVFGYLQK